MSAISESVEYEIYLRKARQQRADEIAAMFGALVTWLKDRRTGKIYPGARSPKNRNWAGVSPDLALHSRK